MSLEKKIIEELKRFNEINKYIIKEQPAPEDAGLDLGAPDAGAPDAGAPAPPADLGAPAAGATPPAAGATPPAEGGAGTEVPEPVDVENDPDVEEVTDETSDEGTEGDAEEIDITDLVTTQQDIKTKQEEFMNNLFTKLDDLQSKLSHMDQIMDKINSLETKFDRYREKTPEEKLMLRSLDSYPYNQKLTDFFDDKKQEMEDTGKNEYVLTSDEVEEFSPNEIKGTFNEFDEIKESRKKQKRRIL
jgi:hypothetical protein